MIISFNNQKYKEERISSDRPLLNVIRIVFSTTDKQWVNRLATANFSIKISSLNNEEKEMAMSQEYLPFDINPYLRQPVFEVNRYFKFSPTLQPSRTNSVKWKIEIVLNNLILNDGESIIIEYMDREHVKKRVDDWEHRVNSLISEIKNWVSQDSDVEFKSARNQQMEEGLMKTFEVPMREIASADIFYKGKLAIAIKPFGLWIMGANGRIDLLTSKGIFVVVDSSEQFNPPKWQVFMKDNKSKGFELTKEIFYQILIA